MRSHTLVLALLPPGGADGLLEPWPFRPRRAFARASPHVDGASASRDERRGGALPGTFVRPGSVAEPAPASSPPPP